ncbi:hypothetical protein AMTRI_Chr02g215350 [Amborella trichopoda]
MQLLKVALKIWSKSLPGNYSQNKISLLQVIQSLDCLEETRPLTDQEATLRSSVRLKYFAKLKKEELFWFQRSRVKWLKARDMNTRYFHRVANCRRRDNTISILKKDNISLTHPGEIKTAAILDYFQTLYAAPSASRPRMTSLDFLPLSDQWRTWLERPFSEEEIIGAIKNLAKDKAPGPDGFPIAPFKIFWDTFRLDFISFFEEFHTKGILHKTIKATFIALVPKVEGAEELKDFRTISLIKYSYKILSKVLAIRLQQVLPLIISPSQTAFIRYRQILDGALVAHKCIHSRHVFFKKAWPDLQGRLEESL